MTRVVDGRASFLNSIRIQQRIITRGLSAAHFLSNSMVRILGLFLRGVVFKAAF